MDSWISQHSRCSWKCIMSVQPDVTGLAGEVDRVVMQQVMYAGFPPAPCICGACATHMHGAGRNPGVDGSKRTYEGNSKSSEYYQADFQKVHH